MYFDGCESLDELKAAYRGLVLKYHPDCGGDTRTMQEINAEHDRVFEILKARQNERARTDETVHATTETPEEFRNIVEALLHIQGLEVELCGCWLWIAGDTRPHAQELKALGCKWSPNKQKWYWRHETGQRWRKHKAYTMDEIREHHGSEWLKVTARESLRA